MTFLAILTVAVMAVSGAVASRAPRTLVQTPEQRRSAPVGTLTGAR
ncbi:MULTISPECIES: hypothetical protein [Nocardiaceae]|nr:MULTISPECIES: hypothetical protein [Rhodococcus]